MYYVFISFFIFSDAHLVSSESVVSKHPQNEPHAVHRVPEALIAIPLDLSTCNEDCGSEWRREYCKSKVGIAKSRYPCQFLSRTTNKSLPRNCQEVFERGSRTSGIYEIRPSANSIMVLCDMETSGGGWTHIHKRFDGSEDFYLNWREYKFGFGELDGEFWIGLENIYLLTGTHRSELLVEVVDKDNNYAYANYKHFQIGPEQDGYPLEAASGFNGSVEDSLKFHIGMKFSTKDVDHDVAGQNCAVTAGGAWWYRDCFHSNLNGQLINIFIPYRKYQSMTWTFDGKSTLSKARMLVKPNL
ncbi:hypothetical protein JTB14_025012 [Gonioctena quinquepunctata]|nr:hypothetical protein JTB14_025012 [Gonioctena quinquepunctata]